LSITTTRSRVTFAHPFSLANLEHRQGPGTYRIDTDEELVVHAQRPASRRTTTYFYMRHGASIRIRKVQAADVEAALERDRRRSCRPLDPAPISAMIEDGAQ
jgi:hypothetical protein